MQNTIDVILLMLIVTLYLLPSLIAFARDNPRRNRVVFINLLFGWTLVAWIVLFLWALLTPATAEEAG